MSGSPTATVDTVDVPATAHVELPHHLSAEPNETTMTSLSDNAAYETTMLKPGSGRALFSTELSTRPPRNVTGPPFKPVIVRSNKIAGVVETALFLRKKFGRISWTIFPQCGWTIEDLWDAEDIHIDTREHYTEVLKFLSQDNFWCARKYAEDWSKANSEQVIKTVGLGDMKSIYNTNDPLAIVDKVFVNGETVDKPREFLWHVAHIMRTALVEIRVEQQCATVNDCTLQRTLAERQPETTDKLTATKTNLDNLPIANTRCAQSTLPVNNAPRKKNGKKIHSQTWRLTVSPGSSSATTEQVSAAFVPRSVSDQHAPLPVVKRVPAQGPPQSGPYHGQPISHVMSGMPGLMMVSPVISKQNLRNPKSRPGPGVPYNQPVAPGVYGENLPRAPSGAYSSRPPSGTMTVMHSPHFNSATMAMGPPVIGPSHLMPSHSQGYPPMSPSAYPAQLYHPDLVHASMMHPSLVHMSSAHVAPIYVNQTSSSQRPRGLSMGDSTNRQYHTDSVPPHSMGTRRPSRQNSFYGSSNNLLYDPYSGSKPAFNDLHPSRRAIRGGGPMDQSGRLRKLSSVGTHPRPASYGNDWVDQVPGNGNRYLPRTNMVDDPNIVGDPVQGCDQTWIGPENHNVNELFVSELPDDVQQDEVRALFFREVNITPTRVTVKRNATGYHPHAFVLFATASDAKLGIRLGTSDPMIRGVPIRITVPRRFYQKTGDYRQHNSHQAASKQFEDRAARSSTRMSSQEEGAIPNNAEVQTAYVYSPQDARSDLQKKISSQVLESDFTTGHSAKVLNSTTSQVFATGNLIAALTDSIGEGGDEKNTTVSALTLESKVAIKDEPATTAVQFDIVSIEEITDAHASTLTDIAGGVLALPQNPLSAIDNPVTTIKESLLQLTPQEQRLNTGHSRVESQKKAVLQNDEPAAVVGKFPDSPQDPEPKVMEASRKDTTGISSAPHDEPESGGEQGASFLSAQEVITKVDSTLVVGAELQLPDHRTNPPKNLAPVQFSTEASVPARPRTTSIAHPEPPSPDTILLERETSRPTPTLVTDNKEAQVMTGSTNEAPMATTFPQLPVVAAKKHGPQQTPSINPFGITKAQRQKEKEQRKKEKRKEQEEKAAKAKAEKVGPFTVSRLATTLTTKSDTERQIATIASPQMELLACSSVASMDTATQTPPPLNGSKSKGKAKVKAQAPDPTDHDSKIEGKEQTSGKKIEGTTIKFSEAVTHNAKVAQKNMPLRAEEKSSIASTLLSLARSSGHNSALPPGQAKVLEPHDEAFNCDLMIANDRSKMRTAIPTIPKLSLNLNPSSNRSMTTQPGASAATTFPLPAVTNPLVPSPNMSQSTYDSDIVSVASSDTLHPNDSVELSPSPTAQEFHTPLQTPAMPPTSQVQIPKPKKKKNKRKKKPAAVLEATVSANLAAFASPDLGKAGTSFAATGNVGSGVDDTSQWTSDPFGNQMSHIDAIRAATKDPDNIFNQINREREEKAVKERDATSIDSEKFRHIQGFLMENRHLCKD